MHRKNKKIASKILRLFFFIFLFLHTPISNPTQKAQTKIQLNPLVRGCQLKFNNVFFLYWQDLNRTTSTTKPNQYKQLLFLRSFVNILYIFHVKFHLITFTQ